MSGLKTVLYAMAGVGLVVLAVAMVSIAFTDRATPLQVALSGDTEAEAADTSFLHPSTVQDARSGYVIAELYQQADPAPVARSAWTHTYPDGVGTCSAEVLLATQQGINDAPPTATPHPTPTYGVPPTPTYQAYPWGNAFPPIAAPPPYPPDATGSSRDPSPTLLYPTPRPTHTPVAAPTDTPIPTPLPTATLQPLRAAVDWVGWQDRPLAIETAGLASLRVPAGTQVRSRVEILTGATAGSQTLLMRSPARNAVRHDGRAHVRLQDASGRMVLDSARTDIDAHYRSAVLHVQAYPLDRCDQLDMRWEQSAAVVVKALTDQPFADWTPANLHPQSPDSAFVGVSYDLQANSLTFTTAAGATVTCDLDNNCPAPSPQ